MTDTALVDWTAAFDRYREANLALLDSMDKVKNAASSPGLDEDDSELGDPVTGEAYTKAGMVLLYVPARHILHVVQKIRVADTLFRISQHHPDFVQILLDDLLSLASLNTSGVQPLSATAQ
jgi:hypothetical protein